MKIATMACALAMLLPSIALAQKVNVQYAHQVDFSQFKTYAWGTNKGELPQKFEDSHIKHAIDRVLQSKGLSQVASGKPDLVVAYQATVGQKEQEIDNYNDAGFGWGWGPGWAWGPGWGYGWGDMGPDYSTTTIRHIQVGDLLVDMMQPATKRAVFRGYATGAFHTNPIKEDKMLTKAVDKMFQHFPPKQK
jgi:hypothetical protein